MKVVCKNSTLCIELSIFFVWKFNGWRFTQWVTQSHGGSNESFLWSRTNACHYAINWKHWQWMSEPLQSSPASVSFSLPHSPAKFSMKNWFGDCEYLEKKLLVLGLSHSISDKHNYLLSCMYGFMGYMAILSFGSATHFMGCIYFCIDFGKVFFNN